MDIVSQLIAKQKAIDIIESCETHDHYDVAQRYVEMYNKMYEDFVGYNQLTLFINDGKETPKKDN